MLVGLIALSNAPRAEDGIFFHPSLLQTYVSNLPNVDATPSSLVVLTISIRIPLDYLPVG